LRMRADILACMAHLHQMCLQYFPAYLHKVAHRKALVAASLFATSPPDPCFHLYRLLSAHSIMHLHMGQLARARHFLDIMYLAVHPGFPLSGPGMPFPVETGYVDHTA